jgi:hypothetical protein
VKRGRGKLLATISSSTPRAQTKPHKEGKSPLMDSARITTSQHNLTKPCLDKPRDHNIKNRKFQSTGAELSRLSHDVEEDFLPVRRRCPGLAGSSVLRDLGFLPLHPHDVEEDFLPVVVLQVSWQQVALEGVRVPDHEADASTDAPRDDGVGHRVGDHVPGVGTEHHGSRQSPRHRGRRRRVNRRRVEPGHVPGPAAMRLRHWRRAVRNREDTGPWRRLRRRRQRG